MTDGQIIGTILLLSVSAGVVGFVIGWAMREESDDD